MPDPVSPGLLVSALLVALAALALAAWARQRLAEGATGLHVEARERMEMALLEAALTFTDGHRGEAATRLGLGRNTVTRKLGSSRRR